MLIEIDYRTNRYCWSILLKPVNQQQLVHIHETTSKDGSFQIHQNKTSGIVAEKYL